MKRVLAILPFAVLAACADDPAPSGADTPSRYALQSDPGTAVSVVMAKAAAPKAEEVVVGRVSDVVKGLAAFQITDAGLDYCGSGGDEMDSCDTPWDYCCIAADEVRDHTLVVEMQGDGGPAGAEPLPDLRPLDLVVVRGELVKDEQGNVRLLGNGYYRRERPQVGDHVKWPR